MCYISIFYIVTLYSISLGSGRRDTWRTRNWPRVIVSKLWFDLRDSVVTAEGDLGFISTKCWWILLQYGSFEISFQKDSDDGLRFWVRHQMIKKSARNGYAWRFWVPRITTARTQRVEAKAALRLVVLDHWSSCLACHAGTTSSRQNRWSWPGRWVKDQGQLSV